MKKKSLIFGGLWGLVLLAWIYFGVAAHAITRNFIVVAIALGIDLFPAILAIKTSHPSYKGNQYFWGPVVWVIAVVLQSFAIFAYTAKTLEQFLSITITQSEQMAVLSAIILFVMRTVPMVTLITWKPWHKRAKAV